LKEFIFMQASLYAIFILIITGVTLNVIYRNRQKSISLKRFFLALIFSFLFFVIVGSFSVTLCYNNPGILLLIFPFLVFLSISMIEPRKIIQELIIGLSITFIAMNILFRSFVGNEYTTSLQFIEDMNKIKKEKGKTDTITAEPLWHTSFTGVYRVIKKSH